MIEKLVIPDDQYVKDLFFATLQHEGYRVVRANEAQENSTLFQKEVSELLVANGNGKVFMYCLSGC